MGRDQADWRQIIVAALIEHAGDDQTTLAEAGSLLTDAVADTWGGLLVDEADHDTFAVVVIEKLAHEAADIGEVFYYLDGDRDFTDAMRIVWGPLRREWRVGGFAEQGPRTIDVLLRIVDDHLAAHAIAGRP